ncbi:MAG: chemotaxis protein CheW [Chitinophagales bacterium]
MSTVLADEIQIVVFGLDKEEYGVDISRVQEIIRVPAITALPGTPEYVLGVTNLRGSIIPIVDTRKKFGRANIEISDEARVIVQEINGNKVGLIVDDVREVVKISVNQVVPADNVGIGIRADYLFGVVRYDDRLLILLDVDKIL